MSSDMNHVERCRALMGFRAVDRLPRWEWAMWWDKTLERWHGEGLNPDLTDIFDIHDYFGLDPYKQYWFSTTEATIEASQHHVEGVVSTMDDYLKHKQYLYPDHSQAIEGMTPWLTRQRQGDAVIWITLEGFFWFPRLLMVGHYDKMVMKHGEQAMRREFERLLPLMNTGGFIPSVDHQTPPDVSLDNYRIYLKLLNEYTD